MQRATADPTPCERCRHRRDMHENFAGVRMCRACTYIGIRWPCSLTRLQEEAVLESLSFEPDTGDS